MTTPHTPAEKAALLVHEACHSTIEARNAGLAKLRAAIKAKISAWQHARDELHQLEASVAELDGQIDHLEYLQAAICAARNDGEWQAAKLLEMDLAQYCEDNDIDLNAPEDDEEEEAPAPAPGPRFSVPPRLYWGHLDDPGIGEFTMSDGYSDQVVGFIGTYQAALAAHPGYYPYLRQIPTEP